MAVESVKKEPVRIDPPRAEKREEPKQREESRQAEPVENSSDDRKKIAEA